VVHGSAVAQLSPLPAGHSFSLNAGQAEARAVGTVYQVSHDPRRQRARITVLSGKVDVTLGREEHGLAQGRRVPAHTRIELDLAAVSAGEPETIGRVEESPVWTQLAVADWWTHPEVGIVELRGEDAWGSSASIDGGPALALPITALLPLGQHRLAITDSEGQQRATDFDVVLGEHRSIVIDAAKPHPENVAEAPRRGASTNPAALLERARELRAAGQARQALVAYGKVRSAFPSSPEAYTVLVTMGKLQLELGQPARALSSFDTYLGGSGSLAPEALGGKVSALRALGRRSDERAAIEQYLSRFPRGFLASRFEQRLESLR